jgi:hypothetical protein
MGYGVFATKLSSTSAVAVDANLVCAVQSDPEGNLTMWTGGSTAFTVSETTSVVFQKLVDAKAGNGIATFPMLPAGGELTVDANQVTAMEQFPYTNPNGSVSTKVRIYVRGGLVAFPLSESKDVVLTRLGTARASNGIIF